MAVYARLARDSGARIIGGRCGTTAEHIRAMQKALNGYSPSERPGIDTVGAQLGSISRGSQAQHSGNMDPLAGAAPRLGSAPGRRKGRRTRR